MPSVNSKDDVVNALLNLEIGEELTLDFRNQNNQKELMKFKKVM